MATPDAGERLSDERAAEIHRLESQCRAAWDAERIAGDKHDAARLALRAALATGGTDGK